MTVNDRDRRHWRRHWWSRAAALLMGGCLSAGLTLTLLAGTATAEFTSYAIVREDGSLLIRGTVVRLFGIYIPDDERVCKFYRDPPSCGARAAVALDFRITGFVTCEEVAENRDGSIDAICYADRSRFRDGTDLAAYLIRKGLALALPNAPFEYQALEKIARSRGVGLWGFPVDSIVRPHRR